MPSPVLNVRVDEEMVEELDRFAADNQTTRSIAVRTLLRTALDQPKGKALAGEVIALLSKHRKLALARFNEGLQRVVEEIQADVGDAT